MRKTIFFDFSGTLVKMRPPRLLVNPSLLRKLSNKFKLGIITGARKRETQNILDKLKIKDLFGFIITADDSKYKKPNPNLFPKAKIRAYIGDSKNDESLAGNANISFFRIDKKCSINRIIRKNLL